MPRSIVQLHCFEKHEQHDAVVSTLHVHLDEHNCLEAVVLKGEASKIRTLANALTTARGVKHSAFVPTTTGRDIS